MILPHPRGNSLRIFRRRRWIVALVKVIDRRPAGGLANRGWRRAGRIAAHAIAWPLLVKAGLFIGFALAATALRVTGA